MASNSMCNLCKLNFKSRAYLILHLGTYHGIQYPQSVAHTMSNRMGVEQPPTTSVEVPESSKKTEAETMTVDPPETTVNVPASLETKVETVADYETETSNSSENNTDDDDYNGPDPLENSDEDSASMKSTESNEDDVSFKYHCVKCNLSFKFNCWYQRHMLIHKPGTFACQYCPKLYKRKDILREHQYLHFGGPKHKCNDCGKEFADKRNLNTHVKLKHEESLIKCPKCEKMYSGKRQLRYHNNRVHSLKKPYKCNKCKEAFPVPCLLSTHRIKMNHCDTLND